MHNSISLLSIQSFKLICLSTHLYIYQFINQSISQSVYLTISLPVYLYTYPPIYLPVCVYAYPPIYLSIYLFFHINLDITPPLPQPGRRARRVPSPLLPGGSGGEEMSLGRRLHHERPPTHGKRLQMVFLLRGTVPSLPEVSGKDSLFKEWKKWRNDVSFFLEMSIIAKFPKPKSGACPENRTQMSKITSGVDLFKLIVFWQKSSLLYQ